VTTPLAPDALLARLVAFNTASGRSNLPLIEWMADYLNVPGAAVNVLPSPDGKRANLLATIGGPAQPGAGLLLTGHTDVVPAGEAGWDTDPFVLTGHDDHWTGRGTCDMKGFVALAATTFVRQARSNLAHPLTLLLTYDEEIGTVGSRDFIEHCHKPLPTATIVGEPTGLTAVTSHKGHLKLAINVRGVAAHSGLPDQGHNAIVPAARAVEALHHLANRWKASPPPSGTAFPDAPYVALNVARIEGGQALNVIPDACRVLVGIRTLPDTNPDQLIGEIRAAVAGALASEDWDLEVLGHSPPLAPSGATAVLQRLVALTDRPPVPGVPFSTDGGWLTRRGCTCVILGPGSMADAHRPNEKLAKAQFIAGGLLVERAVEEFCRSGAEVQE